MTTKSARTPSKRTRELLIVPDQRSLAHFFSVSRTTIQNWIANGMPRLEDGRYCLRECIQWKEKRDAEREQREGRSPELRALRIRGLEARVRSLTADAVEKERKNREISESMLSRAECELVMKLLKEAIRKKFTPIPDRVKLTGLDKKVASMIREELRRQIELVLIEANDFRLPAPIRR